MGRAVGARDVGVGTREAGLAEGETVSLIYDGECPVCRHYARTVRLRESVGELVIIDARRAPAVLAEVSARGLNLDEGMVLKLGSRYLHGADAVHAVALLSSPVGWLNRMNYLLFRSARLSRWSYPAMRGARNLLLRILRKDKIHAGASR